MAADYSIVTELVVDAGPLESGVARATTSLNTIVEASTRAAEGVDRLGAALGRIGQTGNQSQQATSGVESLTRAQTTQTEAAQRSAAAATQAEAAVTRQGAAAVGSAATIERLTAALQQVTAAQTSLTDKVIIGNAPQNSQWLTIFAERANQLRGAIAALTSGMDEATVIERFPAAFEALARGAQLAADSLIVTARASEEAIGAMVPLERAITLARASLNSLVGGYEPAAAGARNMNLQLETLNATIRALTASQNLSVEAIQRMAEAQARLNVQALEADRALASQRIYNIGLGVEPSPNAGFGGGVGTALPGGFPPSTAAQSAAVFQEQMALADSAEKVRAQIDPAGAAFATYNARVAELATLLNTTNPLTKQAYLSQEEYAKAVKLAADAHQASVEASMRSGAAIEDVTKKTNASTSAIHLNRIGTMELQASVVNTFQALSAGMQPLFVAQMEGAQVLGALAQGTDLTVKQMLLMGAPIVAIVAGLALITLRASETQATLRLFNLQLSTFALTAGGPTAEGLKALQDHMRDTGSAAADALKMIVTLNQATTRGVSPAAGAQLVPLARDIAAVTGGDATQEMTKLTNAIAGGVDELTKYGFELGAISVPQATNMRLMAEQGDVAGALRIGVEALSATYKGSFEKSLSDTAKLMIELKNAWNTVVDALAESGVFEFLIRSLQDFAASFKATIAEIQGIYNFFSSNLKKDIELLQGIGVLKTPTQFLAPGTETVVPGSTSGAITFPSTASGGVGTLDTRGLNTASDDLQRLVTVINEGSKTLGEGYAVIATSTTGGTHTPGSFHYAAGAMDVQIVGPEGPIANKGEDVTGKYTQLAVASYLANQRLFPGTPLASGINFGVTPGSSVADLMHLDVGPQRGSLGTPLPELAARSLSSTTAAATSPFLIPGTETPLAGGVAAGSLAGLAAEQDSRAKLAATTAMQTNEVNKIFEADTRNLVVMGQTGAAQRVAAADLAAFNQAVSLGLKDKLFDNFLIKEHEKALKEVGIENKKAADTADIEATGQLKTAEGYRQSAVEGLKAAASTQAQIAARTGVISVEQAYNQILTKNATDAIAAGAQQINAANLQTAATARLAEAASGGTAALHAQELQNEAISRGQDEVNKAEATGNQILIDKAKAQQAALLVSLQANEAEKETLAIRTAINQSRDTREITSLEIGLQGESTDQIRAQVTLLQAQQKIRNDMANADPETKRAYLDEVQAQVQLNQHLAEAERAQGRINDAVRSVADTIDNQLVTVLDDAFNGKKVEDWGATLKKILNDILKQIIDFMFIKPAIGSALGALGFGAVAQQFGSLGGLGVGGAGGGGGIASLFGGGGSPLGTLSQGAGLANNFGGGSTFGGVGNFINNNIGTTLGFAPGSYGGLSAAELADLGVPGATGSLFGATTLTGALGGVGAGFGAGTLLNSVLGGNQTGGQVGALGGAIAGAIIGSVIPGIGTIIGGLIGGAAGGGLGGMFGPGPPNNAAGADLSLLTGAVSRVATSSDAASNQNVQQIIQGVQQFGSQITQLLGVAPDIKIAVQDGVRDGIKVDFGGTLTSLGQQKFADSQSAINAIELDIAHGLDGVSDTMKNVLSHVTDPKNIQDAITFALTYENLKKAADDSFKSISTDTAQIGPFAVAMQQISKTFADLTQKAIQFGVSLDPINAGLAEATKRLQTDFQKSLDEQLNKGTGATFLNDLITTSTTFAANLREASAVGLLTSPPTVSKIFQIEQQQAGATLGSLSADQLQEVITTLGQTNPEIAAMAQAIIDTGLAATTTSTAINNLGTGFTDIKKAITDLTSGTTLSGLTAAQAAAAALSNYRSQLGQVQGGDLSQVSNLSKSATDLISSYQTAYGNAPQTAAVRSQVLDDLNKVAASPAVAAGAVTPATAGATPLQLALSASGTAVTAQAGALTTAITGAAGGSLSTPPGWIVVGEEGPEYIGYSGSARPSLATSNVFPLVRPGMRDLSRLSPGSGWVEVGLHGPERIFQPGGATVLPHGVLPRFAAGTVSSSGGDLISEIRELRGEVAALRKQTQGGQVQAAQDARMGNAHLGTISTRLGPNISAPVRRQVG